MNDVCKIKTHIVIRHKTDTRWITKKIGQRSGLKRTKNDFQGPTSGEDVYSQHISPVLEDPCMCTFSHFREKTGHGSAARPSRLFCVPV